MATSGRPQPLRRLVTIVSDHPVAAVFLAALLIRIVVGIALSAAGLLARAAPDSTFYIELADRVAGRRGGLSIDSLKSYADQFGTFVYPVSWLFRIFGPYVFLAQLFAAVCGAIAAAATTRLAREVVPAPWALVAGGIVAFFPSQVLWSSVPLRDSTVWATTSLLALSVLKLMQSQSVRRIVAYGLAIATLVFLIGYLRAYTLTVVAFALLFVAVVVPAKRYRIGVSLLVGGIALFLPMAMGRGLAATNITQSNLAQVRAANSQGADSRLIPPDEANAVGTGSGGLHMSDIEHLPDGLVAVLGEPTPWTSLQGDSVTIARFESPLWWALVASAFAAIPLLWRFRRGLGYAALYCGGVGLVLALAEGNFGTLQRHRNELVWSMALLSVTAIWTWKQAKGSPLRIRR